MSKIKTYAAGLAVALCTAHASFAQTVQPLAQTFATCVGRYAAEREHGWLVGQNNPQAEVHRAMFEDLLDAVIEDARQSGLSGPELLNMRLSAKHAQARLLHQSWVNTDNGTKQRAAAMARRELRICETMVLGL